MHLLEERGEGFHELLARVVVDALVGRHDHASILGQPLDLLLDIACVMRATVVAPCMHSTPIPICFEITTKEIRNHG